MTMLSELISHKEKSLDVYLIMDASLIPNIPYILDAFRIENTCLFDGEAFEKLGDVAPYLADISQYDPSAEDAIWEIICEGQGIVLFSDQALPDLKRHLKRFVRATVDGNVVYVKFYTARNFVYVLDTIQSFERLFERVETVVLADFGLESDFLEIRRG